MIQLLISILCVLIFSFPAEAATLYVCDSGTDCNAGSGSGWSTGSDSYTYAQAQNKSTPWKTFQKAVNNVSAGDTVIFGDGTYSHSKEGFPIRFAGVHGNSGAWITFRAENEWQAVVDGESTSISSHRVIIEYYSGGASYIKFQGFTFKRGQGMDYGWYNVYPNNITFYKNYFTLFFHYQGNSSCTAISPGSIFNGRDDWELFTIDSNVFFNNGRQHNPSCPANDIRWGHIVYARGCRWLVVNNIMLDQDSGYRIKVDDNDGGCAWTAKILNNTFARDSHDTKDEVIYLGSHGGTGATNVLVANNIVYDIPYLIDNCGSVFEVRNNVMDGNICVSGTPGTNSNNQTVTNPLLVDPGVVGSSFESGDFNLQANSPAIDAGYTGDAYVPSDDYEGTTRDSSPDIGAYEYVQPTYPYCDEEEAGYLICEDWDKGTPCNDPWPFRAEYSGDPRACSWHGWQPATGTNSQSSNVSNVETGRYVSENRSLMMFRPDGKEDMPYAQYDVLDQNKIWNRFYLWIPEGEVRNTNTSSCHLIFLNGNAWTVSLDFRGCQDDSFANCCGTAPGSPGCRYLAPHAAVGDVFRSYDDGVTPFNFQDHEGEWVLIEWSYDSVAETASLWINETLMVNEYSIPNDWGQISDISINGYSQGGVGNCHYYIDDFVVSKLGYIGPADQPPSQSPTSTGTCIGMF